ncbi:MAG: hypothetical protein WDZ30_07240 [Cellvibrionaceae bacterium]
MPKLQISILFMGFLIVSACARNTPEEVSKRYWEALIANDQEAVEQLVVDSSSKGLSNVIEPGPDSRVTFGETVRVEETARVETIIHWADEVETSTFNTQTVLVYEDNTWKVDPVRTREAFFESVYRSALTGLEAALAESAEAFRELGSELSSSMARELSEASRELQEQSEKANEEIQEFLKSLDEELQKELEKRR